MGVKEKAVTPVEAMLPNFSEAQASQEESWYCRIITEWFGL